MTDGDTTHHTVPTKACGAKSVLVRAATLAILSLLVALVVAACDTTALPTRATSTPRLHTTPVAGLAPGNQTEPTPLPSLTVAASPTSRPTRAASTPTVHVAPTHTPTVEAPPSPSAIAASETPSGTPLSIQERLDLLHEVWGTVNDTYLYADFRGTDWDNARDRYEPRVRASASDAEVYALLSEMVAELGDDHSRFMAPEAARSEDAQQRGSADYVGIGIISSPGDRSIMVIYVFPGSPAERAGIMRRDRITHVDGFPFENPRTDPSRIRGAEGTTVRLTVTSPGRQPREIEVVRERISGGVVPSSRRLDTDPTTGYVIIPDLWTGDMDAQVDRELERLLDGQPPLTGLIIDIRGNGGGYRSVLEHVLGNFVSGDIGSFYDKNGTYPFEVPGRVLQQRLAPIPVAVLTDGGTESYAEVLAAALQYRGRAVVVGRATAGNTETIYRYDFDDGSRLWVAQQGFRLPNGTELEARGLLPDEPVAEDWTAYPESDDPDIRRALEALARWNAR